jgi:hypothetical protein
MQAKATFRAAAGTTGHGERTTTPATGEKISVPILFGGQMKIRIGNAGRAAKPRTS